jgi:hypothetical protein
MLSTITAVGVTVAIQKRKKGVSILFWTPEVVKEEKGMETWVNEDVLRELMKLGEKL